MRTLMQHAVSCDSKELATKHVSAKAEHTQAAVLAKIPESGTLSSPFALSDVTVAAISCDPGQADG